jgi:two-component system response regulator AtoC
MNAKPCVLVVDDEEIVRESLASWLQEDGYDVDTASDGTGGLAKLQARTYTVLLVDLKMPGMDGLQVLAKAREIQPDVSIVIMTAYATVDTAVQAMKQGAHDYLMKPFEPEALSRLVGKLSSVQAPRRKNVPLRQSLEPRTEFRGILSRSPRMDAVFELARAAAKSHSTVLILGESGTGKDLLARAIHAESLRREGPFVGVSCSALSESVLESELFGHEQQALTETVSSVRGKFEIAAGGTLFLDEIGDISPKLQLDLLRVLDAKEFRRVGGSQLIQADVRIIASTSRDLKQLVKAGGFREQLYYRLNVIPIVLPPLRERKEDIPLLVDHFLGQFRGEMEKPLEGLTREALEVLLACDWPGNVRELRNVLEGGAALARGTILTPTDLIVAPPSPLGSQAAEPGDPLREVERRHIEASLRQYRWNISRTAKSLGIDRVTLYNKIKRYGIREGG